MASAPGRLWRSFRRHRIPTATIVGVSDPSRMKRKSPVALFSALIALALSLSSPAHAGVPVGSASARASGSISGCVYDQTTGKSLEGAIVRLRETPVSTYTDAEGRFTLQSVPVGVSTVEVGVEFSF